MVATATILTRSIQSESLSAASDRLVNTVVLREGVVDVAGSSYAVAENTGSDMNILVGSGTAFDRAVVEGDVAGMGTFIAEHQNATQQLAVAASDPSLDRIDRVILQVYDDTFDSSGNSYSDIEVLEGTPDAAPVAPALPDSAISLATIEVGNGVTAVTDSDITDARESVKARGELVETLVIGADTTFAKADYPWLRTLRVHAVAGGGGGGGAGATSGGEISGGAGGGGGAYAMSDLDIDELGTSETVTIGAGGGGGVGDAAGAAGADTSFGALVVADGGAGGARQAATSTIPNHVGGAVGGLGTGTSVGDVAVRGGYSGHFQALVVNRIQGGHGGAAAGPFGAGAPTTNTVVNSSAGTNGVAYGAGGSGAANGANQSAVNGGDGGDGGMVIELYA